MAILSGWVEIRLICKPTILCKVFHSGHSQVKDAIVSVCAAVFIISSSKCEDIRPLAASGDNIPVTALSGLKLVNEEIQLLLFPAVLIPPPLLFSNRPIKICVYSLVLWPYGGLDA